MAATDNGRAVVRARADWMRPVDDAILETLRDQGKLTPAAFDAVDVCVKGTANNRLPVLREHGLVELWEGTRGLYQLTELGHAYLDEDLEPGDLE